VTNVDFSKSAHHMNSQGLWSTSTSLRPLHSAISAIPRMAQAIVESIPSPSRGSVGIGPLRLNAYGLMIALGVVAAVTTTSRRWVRIGRSPDEVGAVAWLAVPAGVLGARIYHLMTDWKSYRGNWGQAFKIWDGGLGIWGGVILGTIVGVIVGRRRNLPALKLMDAAAPAIPLAQAIGRVGNWFNIELFGSPTTLPWGLEIPLDKRPDQFRNFTTFHPTFLYELLWNLGVVALVLFVGKRFGDRLKPGRLFAVYVAGYTFGRFWIERIRTDNAYKLLGLRINEWTASGFFLLAVFVLLRARAPKPSQTIAGDQSTVDDACQDLADSELVDTEHTDDENYRVAKPAQ
jgi:prolipoprotein diacylglyceryl transferase